MHAAAIPTPSAERGAVLLRPQVRPGDPNRGAWEDRRRRSDPRRFRQLALKLDTTGRPRLAALHHFLDFRRRPADRRANSRVRRASSPGRRSRLTAGWR